MTMQDHDHTNRMRGYAQEIQREARQGAAEAREETRGHSSDEIRRDIDHTRESLNRTIEELEHQLSPEQIVDRVLDRTNRWLRESVNTQGIADGARGALETATRHPVPLALMMAGISWLAVEQMSGRSAGASRTHRGYGRGDSDFDEGVRVRVPQGARSGYSLRDSGGSGSESALRQRASGVGDSARDTMRGMKSRVSGAADSASHGMHDAADRMRHGYQNIAETADTMMHRAQHGVGELTHRVQRATSTTGSRIRETYEENPLLMGAAAIGVGLLAGLLIPSTRREREMLGEYRDEAMQRASGMGREALSELADEGREMAAHAAHEIGDALEEGDMSDPQGMKRTAKDAARRATSAVKSDSSQKADETLHKAEDRLHESKPERASTDASKEEGAKPTPGVQH